jgi:CrcB protein
MILEYALRCRRNNILFQLKTQNFSPDSSVEVEYEMSATKSEFPKIQQDKENSYSIPDNYSNLNKVAVKPPAESPDDNATYAHGPLEETRNEENNYERELYIQPGGRTNTAISLGRESRDVQNHTNRASKFATQLYTISYLILFSFLGTLARLGLQAVTFYPGAPVVFSELWANFGGCVFMGFLAEDRMAFKEEWGTPTYHQLIENAKRGDKDVEEGSEKAHTIDLVAAKKAHAKIKKTIPLYIGLTTGFCGCFTSFSSFLRDAFLALSNGLPTPLSHPVDYSPIPSSSTATVSRNGGYSFMALIAVILVTTTLCLSGLHIGAHLAIVSEPFIPSIPFALGRKFLDRVMVFISWGCWIGAIMLAIFPPDRSDEPSEIWRGRAVFALVFAPLGCLGRFYASLYLNSKFPSFPLGTFVVNIFGTALIGMSYDLQHVPLGGVVGCQVLQGIEDGFCGCLTTVSTWVSELNSLRRKHAYLYGAISVLVGLCLLVVIMGSMQWTKGFSALQCVH